MTCGADLDLLFPDPETPRTLSGGEVVLHAAPAIATLALWLLVESVRRRPAFPRGAKRAGGAVAVVATATLGVLAWRTFDLLACDDLAVDWRYPTVILTALVPPLGLVAVAPRLPRLAIALFLSLAAGAVVADWALRGGVIASEAAATLVAVQQTWALIAVVAMSHLPGRRAQPRFAFRQRTEMQRARCSSVDATDCLAHRDADAGPSDRSWSWFL